MKVKNKIERDLQEIGIRSNVAKDRSTLTSLVNNRVFMEKPSTGYNKTLDKGTQERPQ